jgi:phosphoribosylaminoimidazole-succinocarboxamide synthase
MEEEKVIKETNLSLPRLKYLECGRKNIYELPHRKKLIMVFTDGVSVDGVMVGAISGKGKIMAKMSAFWFSFFSENINCHFLPGQESLLPHVLCAEEIVRNDLWGRSMVVTKADHVIPIKCVVRGYLVGSGWKEYQETGTVGGINLPRSLQEGSKLPEPIFTPTTGDHENIDFAEMQEILAKWFPNVTPGSWDAETLSCALRDDAVWIYRRAAEYARKRGIIIADTKLEFGWLDGNPILIDEVLTPDSSRFWPRDKWNPGGPQKSFDKQFVRDYLVSIGWNKKPPAPELPQEVVRKTAEKYQEALARLVPQPETR